MLPHPTEVLMKSFAGIAVLVLICGCEKEVQIQPRTESADPSEFYTVQASTATGTVGMPISGGFEIKPARGWKINEEYPWKFEVLDAPGVTVTPTLIEKSEMTLSSGLAKIPFTAVTASPGAHEVKATGRLSICSPDACHNFLHQEIVFTIEAQ